MGDSPKYWIEIGVMYECRTSIGGSGSSFLPSVRRTVMSVNIAL